MARFQGWCRDQLRVRRTGCRRSGRDAFHRLPLFRGRASFEQRREELLVSKGANRTQRDFIEPEAPAEAGN